MKKNIASNIEWKRWGALDPLMGVATRRGKDRYGPNAWTDEEFYKLGRSDWQDFFERWSRYGVDKSSCLEVGCGTGRITSELQHCFEKVFALDISEGMIEYAKKHITGSSVSFLLGDGVNIPLPDSSVTSVFSTHVFQHFDSLSHASGYFKEIRRVLAPGGTLMIHLPVHHWPAMPGVFEFIYRVRKRIGDARAWIRRQLIRAGMSHHFMRGLSYPDRYLFDILSRLDFVDVEILVFQTTSERAFHAFVFARRKQHEA